MTGQITSKEKSITILQPFFEKLKNLSSIVALDGWEKINTGCSSQIDYNYRFDLYVRERKLSDIKSNGEITNISPLLVADKAAIYKGSGMVSNTSMGLPQTILTPSSDLPVLSHFGDYPSLIATRSNTPSLILAFDSEWIEVPYDSITKREVLSWQFATINGSKLIEFIFLRKNLKFNLHLELALGRILDYLKLNSIDIRSVTRYSSLQKKDSTDNSGEADSVNSDYTKTLYLTRTKALENSQVLFPDGKKVHIEYDWSEVSHIPLTLLCHTGKVDISTFDQDQAYRKNIIKYCTEVQGGVITLQPTSLYPGSVNPAYAKNNHSRKYPIALTVADTMCHAPAKKRKLEDLGKAIGWEKINLSNENKSHMNCLFVNNPILYFQYASTDSVVTLLYAASLYGYNRKLPVTLTSATATVMKGIMMKYLNCNNTKEFDRVYRGIEIIKHGKVPRDDRPGYIESTSKEPISRDALIVQSDASNAYHGGYNSCSDIGYFPFPTTDYDLKNAYPTAMCLIPDIDWDNPIKYEIKNEYLTLQHFSAGFGGFNPISMMFAYVDFKFPKTVKYPCIPINVDGIPIYPRTSEGVNGIYACGPELYLALKLGAEIYVHSGYFLNSLFHNGAESYSLRQAVKQFVVDRNNAVKDHKKRCIEELILKVMVNSGYGKNAQNVIQKNTWSAYNDEMGDIGCSSITNPVSAAIITSIVRAELLAAQNQCHELGFMTCSVTTDGFISNCPEDVLKRLDLYGIRKFMEHSRLFLTDGKNPEIWEVKHMQDDLVNFTTRGNVSLCCKKYPYYSNGKPYEGVCAHNSVKSGFASDTFEDRLWLMIRVLSRTGTIDYTDAKWSKFKDLAHGKDFSIKPETRKIRMDYDMKRKPVRESFETKSVPVDGNIYEIANFTTVAFENVAEFRLYRQKKDLTTVLRTQADWDIFWQKLDYGSCGMKIRNPEWSILNSCIIGHRMHRFSISKLDELSGQARCDWINSHNTSTKIFTLNDWKNAGRPARQVNMLPQELIQDKLNELISDK